MAAIALNVAITIVVVVFVVIVVFVVVAFVVVVFVGPLSPSAFVCHVAPRIVAQSCPWWVEEKPILLSIR